MEQPTLEQEQLMMTQQLLLENEPAKHNSIVVDYEDFNFTEGDHI